MAINFIGFHHFVDKLFFMDAIWDYFAGPKSTSSYNWFISPILLFLRGRGLIQIYEVAFLLPYSYAKQ